ncbi:Cys/Met metabolism PLP-dependent enzyme/Aminotransferase class I and II/DegT/DnrJ/EryC1/StrS aminotransferase family/Aminotransferase class-V, putative [Angomonas deanei]|uniref:Cys/Met metabolism PLP-dependent enzyme/Aminotransferase class I and II/DegT/DnrJ/EryC1/StrS aminotransferase family/Aminotransferase class-V, putative n=1 Tax=Angomonas deanei TaxID=59799 RepID=A0A7G2CDC4_9TRYP|nr:Cys/Met metabolism PLP-dependent enzyme/Aminotransferase class I and II/DegT/DnrJ/EryC1/StrS aminotransferase family/Aminotransferase class-V, putative [Angomonas deanei]
MSEANYRFDTLQVHAGQVVDSTKSRAVPIYQSTSFLFDDCAHGAALFHREAVGTVYTRSGNPTTAAFEKRVAALEGGVGALATASGMSAIFYAICNLAQCGDEIISLATLYGGTYTLFDNRLESQFGIKTRLVDPEDFDALEKTINDKTKAIFFESIGNPGMNIPDIERITAIAHKHGIPVVVDNTFGTPYLIQLKDHGVDVIVHSATKYIGGHGTSIGGVIVDIGKFQYKGNPRFPQYAVRNTIGVVYGDLGPTAFIDRARSIFLVELGACISPFNSFLLLLGLETLSLRVQRHVENAQAVAKHLQKHPHVAWVSHPDLPDNKFHERAKKYFPKGSGAIFTFGVKGGKEASIKFIDSLKLFSLLANVADAKSLAIHPAGTTHSQLDEEGLKRAGVLPELVRLSIGIEDINDIIEDIDQALEKSQK